MNYMTALDFIVTSILGLLITVVIIRVVWEVRNRKELRERRAFQREARKAHAAAQREAGENGDTPS